MSLFPLPPPKRERREGKGRVTTSRPPGPPQGFFTYLGGKTWDEGYIDAEAGMLLAEASSAICVQRFDDSRNSAIHITYRISLRSSSLREPRYPLLRVVLVGVQDGQAGCTKCFRFTIGQRSGKKNRMVRDKKNSLGWCRCSAALKKEREHTQ